MRVVVRHGSTTVIVNVVVSNFVGNAVTFPVKVTVYVPIWLWVPLYIWNCLFDESKLKVVRVVGVTVAV